MKQIFQISLIILLFYSVNLTGQTNQYFFHQLSTDDGLSQNSVYCSFQDSKGYMWFGTSDGLNRYDGYSFKVYKHIVSDYNSLSDNWITGICEDRKGNLWIATHGGGLNKFNEKTNTFKRFITDTTKTYTLKSNIIRNLLYLKSEILWIGTDNGLNKFDIKSERFIKIPINSDSKYKDINVPINNIKIDKNKNLWIATWDNGLIKYNISSHIITNFIKGSRNRSVSINRIKTLALHDSILWIGTYGGGINKMNIYSEEFEYFSSQKGDASTLSSNYIYSLYLDKEEQLWVGTYNDGLNLYQAKNNEFQRFLINDDNQSIKSNWIPSISEDESGLLWVGTDKGVFNTRSNGYFFKHIKLSNILKNNTKEYNINVIYEAKNKDIFIGTWGNGLFVKNYNTKKVSKFIIAHEKQFIGNNKIWTITEDENNNLWIGTGKGLVCINRKTKSIKEFLHKKGNDNSLPYNNISSLNFDSEGFLWIGTWGGGVIKYDTKENTFISICEEKYKAFDKYINRIFVDSTNIWVGTHASGLHVYNTETGTQNIFLNDINDAKSIPDNNITAITKDKNGYIWLGFSDAGICKINKDHKICETYTKKDGLVDNYIAALIFDKNGILWISTHNGLSQFNPKTTRFYNYTKEDGLQSNQFTKGYCLSSDSIVYFGGSNGYNEFNPYGIKRNIHVPKIEISKFKLFNKEENLHNWINKNNELELTYEDYVISFEFVALDFHAPTKNQYMYQLDGFDKDYIFSGNRNFVTYTNLPPGAYTFKVTASNSDDVWNGKAKELKIIVKPPYWKTWWFYTLVIVLIALVIYLYVVIRLNNLKKIKERLELKVAERTITLEMQKQTIQTVSDELGEKNIILEEKNKEILESILYAQHIQKSIFPPIETLGEYFDDSFIFLKPKDILSGDFYYMNRIVVDNKEHIYLASVDCTGHGVSGALMSVIGNEWLEQTIVKSKRIKASDILQDMHNGILKSLHKSDDEKNINVGMDMSLIHYIPSENIIEYAGANRPLYYIRDNKFHKIKSNRSGIACPISNPTFKSVMLDVKPNDKYYIFSDGYSDQFGGPNGKKFLSKQFQCLILKTSKHSMKEQRSLLIDAFDKWKTNYEQIDDVLVIGFSV